MAVTRGQFGPVGREVQGVRVVQKRLVLPGAVVGLGFAPDADVGVHVVDILYEIVIIASLIRPHPVLDIPIKDADLSLPGAGA